MWLCTTDAICERRVAGVNWPLAIQAFRVTWFQGMNGFCPLVLGTHLVCWVLRFREPWVGGLHLYVQAAHSVLPCALTRVIYGSLRISSIILIVCKTYSEGADTVFINYNI